ncbi:hypothetical protein BH09ACT10_BH09ACT10_03410 [soil metagenome]
MDPVSICLSFALTLLPADHPVRWGCVLAGIDATRSEAFALADPERLREVYARGSELRGVDRAVMEGYSDRGLRVRSFTMTVSDLRVISQSGSHVVLRVVDRVDHLSVVDERGAQVRVPNDLPTARLLALRREHGAWRIDRSTDEEQPR